MNKGAIIAYLIIVCIVPLCGMFYFASQSDKKESQIWEMRKDYRIKVWDLEQQLHICQKSREMDRRIDSLVNETIKMLRK